MINMKIYPKCIPCLLKRAYYEVSMSEMDEEKKFEAISKALESLSDNFSKEKATFEVSTEMHRAVYDLMENDDPYKEKKELGNEIAEKLVPKIRALVKNSENSFERSVVASIISNSFDFGVLEHDVDLEEIADTFPKKVRESKLGFNDIKEIKQEIKDAEEIGFVVDNCGEIIFDKIFLEEIKKVTSANLVLYVRGQPIFNDVTLEEAEKVNVGPLVDEIKELGERAVGVHPEYMDRETKEKLFSSDLIISKGMANYESFSEIDDDLTIAYILKTKCEPVADSIGAEVGENIAYLNN